MFCFTDAEKRKKLIPFYVPAFPINSHHPVSIAIVRYSKIEEIYGWKVFDEVMRQVSQALENITGHYLRDSDIVAELMISGNSFVIVLSPPRNAVHMLPADRDLLARRVEARVREQLAETMDPVIYRKFGCYTGSTTVKADPKMRIERLVHA